MSNLIAATTLRNYSVTIGDFNADGKKDILLSNQDTNAVGSPSLSNYSNGGFQTLPFPISQSDWSANGLDRTNSLSTADFNGDGYDDLLLGGMWHGRTNTVVYGGPKGLNVTTLKALAPCPYGQDGWDYRNEGWPIKRILNSCETISISFDFNNDGKPDVFSTSQQWIQYPPGTITDTNVTNYASLLKDGGSYFGYSAYTTSTNVDGNNFVATIPANSNLGYRFYFTILPYDINRDGNLDVIGYYFTVGYGSTSAQLWGTMFFLNDGHGNFSVVDGVDVFPQLAAYPYRDRQDYRSDVGAIIPISNDSRGFVGLQLLSEPDQKGKYLVQKFSSSPLTQTNLPPRH